jgi:hypothetical protein
MPLMLAMAVSGADESGHEDAPGKVIRLSEPVEATESYEVFGSPLDAAGPAVGLQELVSNSDQYLDKQVLVTTRIAKVCQKKGCFFVAQEGEAVARVTFKDYGFFIPTDSGGKTVTLAGTFVRTELSPEKAHHYRKDLGEAPARPAAAATMEYQIVATSVRIPKG